MVLFMITNVAASLLGVHPVDGAVPLPVDVESPPHEVNTAMTLATTVPPTHRLN
jgi:hypothetical protein